MVVPRRRWIGDEIDPLHKIPPEQEAKSGDQPDSDAEAPVVWDLPCPCHERLGSWLQHSYASYLTQGVYASGCAAERNLTPPEGTQASKAELAGESAKASCTSGGAFPAMNTRDAWAASRAPLGFGQAYRGDRRAWSPLRLEA